MTDELPFLKTSASMGGTRAVRFDATFGAAHDCSSLSSIHIFPVTQQKGLALTWREVA